jgi:Uncharacterized conserved protein (some members contain a von Willebrand factor type A (vWA) domain)
MRSTKEIVKKIRRLELTTRRMVETAFAGQYHSVFRGRGMNFDDFRPYQIGDEIRTIDWNVTARMGEAFVRKYVEERELTVLLLVDISASGGFGSVLESKREVAAEVASLLAFCAIRNNDNVGLLLFTDRTELYIPPKKGRTHTLRLIREILFFEPGGRGTDLAKPLEFINRVTTRRAVIFLLSDFQANGFERPLSICARKHDLIAVPIEDPGDWQLPPVGIVEVQDPETGVRSEIDFSNAATRREFARLVDEQRKNRDAIFLRGKAGIIPLRTDQDYFPALRSFFIRRQRLLRSR